MCSRNAGSIGIDRCSGGRLDTKGMSVSVVILTLPTGQLSSVMPAFLALSCSRGEPCTRTG